MKTDNLITFINSVNIRHELQVSDIIKDFEELLMMLNGIDINVEADINYIYSDQYKEYTATKDYIKLKLINKISTL